MPFDLETAIPVLEREDGLNQKTGDFDISTAAPVSKSQNNNLGTELRSPTLSEKDYIPSLTPEQRQQAVVELSYREKGEQVPSGIKFDWDLTSPKAQAVTQAVIAPDYAVFQGIRGAIQNRGEYDLMGNILKGVVEPENTKKFYENIPGVENLPDWAKTVAGVVEDIAGTGVVAVTKSVMKSDLLVKSITKKVDNAAEQFASEYVGTYLDGSNIKGALTGEDVTRINSLFSMVKNNFKETFLRKMGAFDLSTGKTGFQGYAERRSLLGLIIEDIQSSEAGQLRLPKIGQTVSFKTPDGVIKSGVIKEITGERAIIDMEGKNVVAALSQLNAPVKSSQEKEPWQMTREEWDKVRENLNPEIAQQNYTKRSGSEAAANVKALLKHLYGVNDEVKEAMRSHMEGKIKLSPDEISEVQNKLNTPVRHYDVVKKALSEGKPVPPEVLDEYPDLSSPISKGKEIEGKKYKNAEDFVKKKGIDSTSVNIIDNDNFIVENLSGNNALLTELPVSVFGKPKFKTLAEYKPKPGRKIVDPIEVTYEDGKYIITDGANRFTQALANKDKTIPVILRGENLEQLNEQFINRQGGEKESEYQDNIESFLSKLDELKGVQLSREAIFEKYDNELKPFGEINQGYADLLGSKDNKVYSGEAYLIDHHIHNHPNTTPEEYRTLSEVLSNPDDVKENTKEGNKGLIFIKKYDKYHTAIANLDLEDGKIVLHKTFFAQKKKPYEDLPSVRLNSDAASAVRNQSGLSSETPGRSLPARASNQNIPQEESDVKGKIIRGLEGKKEAMQERLTTVEQAKAELEGIEPIHKAFLRRIRKYKDGYLKEELQGFPKQYITTQGGITPDEVLEELRNNWGVDLSNETDLKEYFQDMAKQIDDLDEIIETNKPKMVRHRETTILNMQDKAQEQMRKKAEREMQQMTEEQARITSRLEKKAYREGKVAGEEVRKQKYFGSDITKEQRRELYVVALRKGVIYTDFSGKKHDKLQGIIRYYKGASFDQLKDYLSSLSGSPESPARLFKLYGNIDRDAEALKIINKEKENWQDINKVEVHTLDPVRAIEKVTQRGIWEDNILADNTFNVIEAADDAMFDRKVKELTELDKNREGVLSGSKESSEIMRKFEAKEPLTPKEQKVADYLRMKYDAWIKEANEMRALVGKKPIPYRKDYMTHIIEQNLLHDFFKGDEGGMNSVSEAQLDAIRKGDYTKGNMPFNRFALKRLGDKTKYDAIGNYIKYMDVVLKEIYYTPAISHSRKFIEYALTKQPNAYKSLDRLLNDLKGKTSIADQNFVGVIAGSKAIKTIRGLIARNALVGNINFWTMNLSNFAVSYDELGNYLNVGMEKFLGSKEWRKFAFENSVMLKGRAVDPDFIDKGVFTKLEEVVGGITNLIEYNNVGSTFVGAYIKATEKLHYPKDKAIEYADAIARRTQVGYKKYELNAWMRSNSGMLLSQFQSWTFNAMNHILYDLGTANIPKDIASMFTKDKTNRTRWGALMRLIAVAITADAIYNWMGLREPYTLGAAIPSVSGLNPGRYSDIGPVRIIKDIGTAITGKKAETRKNAAIRAGTFWLPGGTQLSRFLAGRVYPKNNKESEYKERAR